jgi:hypothetical protein
MQISQKSNAIAPAVVGGVKIVTVVILEAFP